MVPQAGARAGTANGIETSAPGLANPDLGDIEEGQRTPSALAPSISQSPIPILRIN